jgi:hypothetical protein
MVVRPRCCWLAGENLLLLSHPHPHPSNEKIRLPLLLARVRSARNTRNIKYRTRTLTRTIWRGIIILD